MQEKVLLNILKSVAIAVLGNICQSLTPEKIFKKLVTDQNVLGNWRVHSAATSMHKIESPPVSRAQLQKKHDTPMNHTVQAGYQEDCAIFDYILCMDESNLRDLNRKSMQGKNGKAKMEPLRNPYYVSDSKLKTVYQQCVRCSVLDKVR
uniref:Low molecular weight phosphotyrosine protein phosphatase n=1 Tax=Canis lupus familiaris TaxID=9615 RepID=A0A8C0NLK1_CANLF